MHYAKKLKSGSICIYKPDDSILVLDEGTAAHQAFSPLLAVSGELAISDDHQLLKKIANPESGERETPDTIVLEAQDTEEAGPEVTITKNADPTVPVDPPVKKPVRRRRKAGAAAAKAKALAESKAETQ